jgi:hypothetical protein
MGAAASGLGVAAAVLKAAKKAGCIAFRASRVHRQEIRDWLAIHPSGAPAASVNGNHVDDRLKEAKADREEIKLQRERGELLDRRGVQEAIRGCVAKLVSVLDREFGSELPPILKGLDERSIRAVVLDRLARLEKVFRQEISSLVGPP